jgi:hypothetical protein
MARTDPMRDMYGQRVQAAGGGHGVVVDLAELNRDELVNAIQNAMAMVVVRFDCDHHLAVCDTEHMGVSWADMRVQRPSFRGPS